MEPPVKIGHPYMEVQRINKSEPEILPDWLLDSELSIFNLPKQAAGSPTAQKARAPAMNWHKSLQAEQVHYYCKKKYSWNRDSVPYIRSTDDSDSCKFVAVHLIPVRFSI